SPAVGVWVVLHGALLDQRALAAVATPRKHLSHMAEAGRRSVRCGGRLCRRDARDKRGRAARLLLQLRSSGALIPRASARLGATGGRRCRHTSWWTASVTTCSLASCTG